jgi:hypothetical protein
MTMMSFDHDKFLPPFVKLSTSPYCTKVSSQFNNNAQHGARYNSTKRTTLPVPGKSQRTHLNTVNVHNATRPIDSAHFAQPKSDNCARTHCCPSLVHLCSNKSPASSTRSIVSYIGRQYTRTVSNVDFKGSSKCHTTHLAIGGVARFNYVPVTNLNTVMACTSDRQVYQDLRVKQTSLPVP